MTDQAKEAQEVRRAEVYREAAQKVVESTVATESDIRAIIRALERIASAEEAQARTLQSIDFRQSLR